MTRKTDHAVKSGHQSTANPFQFVLSTETVDRVGDIIRQDGWDLAGFKANPVALFGHEHSFPIGTWEDVKVVGKRLVGTLRLAEKGTSARIDEIRSLIEQRILKAVSVGFRIKKYEPLDKKDPFGGWDIQRAELHETSVVSVPANPEAISLAKSIGVSDETLKLAFGRMSADQKPRRSMTADKTASRNLQTKGKVMKLGDKIVSAEEHLNDLRDQIADIVKEAEDTGRALLPEETDQIEALEGDIEAAEKSLSGLKSAEKALARRSENKEKSKVSTVPATAKGTDRPSDLLFKMAHVNLRAFVEKKAPETVLAERYGHDPRVEAVVKAATTPAYTNVAGWAQELTDTALVGFISELKPVSVYGAMAAAGTAIPFGDNNAVTMPRRTGLGQVPGSFVGEGNTIPVKQGQFGSQTFNRYKAAVITAFSKELQRVSNPMIEGLLRDAIITDTGIMLDSVVTDPTSAAVAGIRPASPWYGAATQASAGDTLADILTDLRFLMDTLSAANAGRNPRIFMNPARLTGLSMLTNANGSFVFRDEIAQGRLMGIPLTVSTNVPADHVFIMDMADFATAFGVPEFDTSEQATLVMADDDGVAPTMADTNAVSAAGSLHVSDAAGTTPPTVVRSMFQTWELALRMVMPISWGMMRTGTSAYLTAVSW
jgi:HK97 family phage major capsid protein/HK97 family phage prohead protease